MNQTRFDAITQMIVAFQAIPNAAFPGNRLLATQGKNVNLAQQTGEALWSRYSLKNARVSNRFERTNGVYLWMILLNTATGQTSIRFVKTNIYFEFGAKHFMLKNRSAGMVVIGAGELQIWNGRIGFNLLSGTYQVPILNYLRTQGVSDQEISVYYNTVVKLAFGAPDAEILVPFSTPIVDTVLLQHFTRANLNTAGIPFQDIKFSTTKWLKHLVMAQTGWTPQLGAIGKKMGTKSTSGAVFKLKGHPELLVKISLLPFKTNGQPAVEFHNNEVRGYQQALAVGATPVEIRAAFVFQAAPDPRFGEIYQLYVDGSAPTISVIVMTNFFWPATDFTSSGNLYDLVQRDPASIPAVCKVVRQLLRKLHLNGRTRHGDAHPGNILFRKRAGGNYEVGLIDFGGSLEDNTMSNEPIITRGNRQMNTKTNLNGTQIPVPQYANRNIAGVHMYRTPNAWFMEHFYNR